MEEEQQPFEYHYTRDLGIMENARAAIKAALAFGMTPVRAVFVTDARGRLPLTARLQALRDIDPDAAKLAAQSYACVVVGGEAPSLGARLRAAMREDFLAARRRRRGSASGRWPATSTTGGAGRYAARGEQSGEAAELDALAASIRLAGESRAASYLRAFTSAEGMAIRKRHRFGGDAA